jgi:hypothetical protein
MSFTRPIRLDHRYGLEVVWVEVPLTVRGSRGALEQQFIFDTGCQITTVSEDVAVRLGLSPGGRAVNMHGLVGGGTGRLVEVQFQFPRTVSGTPGVQVTSTWVVLSGARHLALLGFREVERLFCIRTLEFDMYFIPWTSVHGR